jgi:hypothetical protein
MTTETLERILAVTTGFLSLCGSSFILASYIRFKDTRTAMNTLVMSLSISDIFASANYLIAGAGLTADEFICHAQAFSMQLFELSSILWSGCMSIYLIAALLVNSMSHKTAQPPSLRLWYPLFVLIGWVAPAVAAVYLWLIDAYGPAGLWCWQNAGSLRFILFYDEVLVVVVFNIVVYLLVIAKMIRSSHKKRRRARQGLVVGAARKTPTAKIASRMQWYLCAFFGAWLAPSLKRVLQFIDPDLATRSYAPALDVAVALLNPASGLFNALIYGTSGQIFARWRGKYDDSDVFPDSYLIDVNPMVKLDPRQTATMLAGSVGHPNTNPAAVHHRQELRDVKSETSSDAV